MALPGVSLHSMALPGLLLFQLRGLQDQLLRLQSTNRGTPSVLALRPPAGADDNYLPGPPFQPVHLNTVPATQWRILGEPSLEPETAYFGSNCSRHCLVILAKIKSKRSPRLTLVMPRYLSQNCLHTADHIKSSLETTSRSIAIPSQRVVYVMERGPNTSAVHVI